MALPALRDTLLECVARAAASGPTTVLTQLLLALASLAIQWGEWPDALSELGVLLL